MTPLCGVHQNDVKMLGMGSRSTTIIINNNNNNIKDNITLIGQQHFLHFPFLGSVLVVINYKHNYRYRIDALL